jgi:acyl-CoA reductase-like NAD-dependent aldehyde dehydrogenase
MKVLHNFIDGEYVPSISGESSEIINPSTGKIYTSAPISNHADIDNAMKAAERGFKVWADSTPSERQRALLKIADAFESRAEELIAIESENTGKPLDRLRRDPTYGRSNSILCWRRAQFRGKIGGRVHARHDLIYSSRTHWNLCAGNTVELSDDDGGLEVCPSDSCR